MNYITRNREETHQKGAEFAEKLKPGNVVALYGDLGSGKTVFAQGICKGLHVTAYVTSPSFTLVQEYSGDMDVFHFDFYRLTCEQQVETLGIDYYFERNGVSIIEWPEIAEKLLPETTVKVKISRFFEKGKLIENMRNIDIV